MEEKEHLRLSMLHLITHRHCASQSWAQQGDRSGEPKAQAAGELWLPLLRRNSLSNGAATLLCGGMCACAYMAMSSGYQFRCGHGPVCSIPCLGR